MNSLKHTFLLLFVLSIAFTACNHTGTETQKSKTRIIKGLYSYGPEIKSFTDCEEGREYWVADSSKTLELGYSKFNFEKPYEPVYIEAECHAIKSDSLVVSADFDSTLVVTKLIKITREIPDGPCKNEDLIGSARLTQKDSTLSVAIPGELTTANFLLGIAFPNLLNKQVMVFSEIQDALLNHSIDLGLIIHENRFTYTDKGLHKIVDLGSYWEELTGCAIPLGGIVINRKLDHEVQLKVNRLIRKSVEFAFQNPKSGIDFISAHAQEMEEAVMYKHIDLYVNKYSIDLGTEGRKAIDILFKMAQEKGIIPEINQNLYVTN